MNIIIKKIAFKSAIFSTQIEKIISECYKSFKVIVNRVKHSRQLLFTEDFKINYYLYQAFYGDMIKILFVLLFSLLLNTFIETAIAIVSFAGLRFFSGGYHAKSYESCFVMTISIYILAGIFSKYLLTNISINNIILSIVISILIFFVLIFAPKFLIEFTKEKKRRYKFYSVIFILVCYGLSFVLDRKLYLPLYTGLIFQVITIIPVGYSVLNSVDKIIKIREI
jgi:accessory gene regulator B